MKRILFFPVLVLFTAFTGSAQQNIGIGTTTPHASAALDISSSTKGVLIPRMNTAQRTAVAAPAKGLIVFDNESGSYWYYNGMAWREMAAKNFNSDSNMVVGQQTGTINSYNLVSDMNITDSSGYLYDSGGPGGNYGNDQDYSLVLYAVPPVMHIAIDIRIIATDLENPYDSITLSDNYGHYYMITGSTTGTYRLLEDVTIRFKTNSVNTRPGFVIRWDKIFPGDPEPYDSSQLTGWYFDRGKLYMRGGDNGNNDWHPDSSGILSFGFGSHVQAKGPYTMAAGYNSKASGNGSIALGRNALASGNYGSVAMGNEVSATGNYGSTAFGTFTQATGSGGATALGFVTLAGGNSSLAAGEASYASGNYSVAMGSSSIALADASMAMGLAAEARGNASVSLGSFNIASGASSFAAGGSNQASGNYSTALGSGTQASGIASTALGTGTTATALASISLGNGTKALGTSSLATGFITTARTTNSTAMGYGTVAKAYSGFVAGLYNDTTNAVSETISLSARIFEIGAGTSNSSRYNAMTVLQNGNVGIGTLNPSHQLVVAKSIRIDDDDDNDGTTVNSLFFGNAASGEAIGSKRTSGGNRWGLDFYTNSINRMNISNTGVVTMTNTLNVNGNITVQNGKGLVRSTSSTQQKIQTVTVSVNVSLPANTATSINFTWPESFTGSPVAHVGNVTSGSGGWADVITTLSAISATGGTLNVSNPRSTSTSINFSIVIIGIGGQ